MGLEPWGVSKERMESKGTYAEATQFSLPLGIWLCGGNAEHIFDSWPRGGARKRVANGSSRVTIAVVVAAISSSSKRASEQALPKKEAGNQAIERHGNKEHDY